MAIQHIIGSTKGVTTGISKTGGSNKDSSIVTVEGPVSVLETITDFDSLAPAGMTVESHTLEPNGDGFGKLIVRCINYGSGDVSTTPTRTTWRISMQEVQKNLKDHPHFDDNAARKQIEAWLAMDPDKRYDANGNPQCVMPNGEIELLTYPATDYVTAYEKGIETYVRHFPVLEKISYYKTLPGCSMNNNSTTSGTVSKFSADIDKWNVPDVKLAGYANTGWFKSGDNYEQGNDLVWTRTQQWTWTPDGSNSKLGWIYANSNAKQNN